DLEIAGVVLVHPIPGVEEFSTFSTIPFGDCMDLSAISIIILIGFGSPRPDHLNMENGITLMLAPKSAKALLTVVAFKGLPEAKLRSCVIAVSPGIRPCESRISPRRLKVTEGGQIIWIKVCFNPSQVSTALERVLLNHCFVVPTREMGNTLSITVSFENSVNFVDRERSRVLPGAKLSFMIIKRGKHFSIATPGHDKKRANRLDKKMFKYNIPPFISETLMYQRLARHPVNVQTFPYPILYLVGLKSNWKHSLRGLRSLFVERVFTVLIPLHMISFVLIIYLSSCFAKMAFGNFMFAADDDEMSLLTKEPSNEFGTGSPSSSINKEDLFVDAEPISSANPDQLIENSVESEGSPVCEKSLALADGNVAERISPPKVFHQKISKANVESSSFVTISDDDGFPEASELKTSADCRLLISNITLPSLWGHLDNQSKIKGECEVIKEGEKAREKEYEKLKAKCEATMKDFDKNPAVVILRQKIVSLLAGVKKHKGSLDMMLLESQKWAGYKENLATLESKVSALEIEKCRLEEVEAQLRQEIENVKRDRAEVVSKVVLYIAM
ncbi:hypothetical protein Tco_1514379, partial [Tanacetum coccineum]